jgi:hypothetical protein
MVLSIERRYGTHYGFLEELLRVLLPFRNNVILRPFISLIEPQPDAAEVKFLDEPFTRIVPSYVATAGHRGSERWPVRIVEQNFEAGLPRELGSGDVEDYDSGF